MNRKERNQLLRECRQATCYDIWWDGDKYIVEDTGFRCKSIHDLAYYCEVYEDDGEEVFDNL